MIEPSVHNNGYTHMPSMDWNARGCGKSQDIRWGPLSTRLGGNFSFSIIHHNPVSPAATKQKAQFRPFTQITPYPRHWYYFPENVRQMPVLEARMTKAEAIDILSQCRLLRESIDALCARADSVLRKPDLRVVSGRDFAQSLENHGAKTQEH